MSVEEGLKPQEINSALIDRASKIILGKTLHINEDIICHAMDPKHSVLAHQMPGGPAPQRMREELDIHQKKLDSDVLWTKECRERIDESSRKLEKAIDAIMARKV